MSSYHYYCFQLRHEDDPYSFVFFEIDDIVFSMFETVVRSMKK